MFEIEQNLDGLVDDVVRLHAVETGDEAYPAVGVFGLGRVQTETLAGTEDLCGAHLYTLTFAATALPWPRDSSAGSAEAEASPAPHLRHSRSCEELDEALDGSRNADPLLR